MIQLYVMPSRSGAYSILRKLDGVYTLISDYGIGKGLGATYPPAGDYYLTTTGIECSQDWAEHVTKSPLLDPEGSAKNYMFYGIKGSDIYKD